MGPAGDTCGISGSLEALLVEIVAGPPTGLDLLDAAGEEKSTGSEGLVSDAGVSLLAQVSASVRPEYKWQAQGGEWADSDCESDCESAGASLDQEVMRLQGLADAALEPETPPSQRGRRRRYRNRRKKAQPKQAAKAAKTEEVANATSSKNTASSSGSGGHGIIGDDGRPLLSNKFGALGAGNAPAEKQEEEEHCASARSAPEAADAWQPPDRPPESARTCSSTSSKASAARNRKALRDMTNIDAEQIQRGMLVRHIQSGMVGWAAAVVVDAAVRRWGSILINFGSGDEEVTWWRGSQVVAAHTFPGSASGR